MDQEDKEKQWKLMKYYFECFMYLCGSLLLIGIFLLTVI